MSAVFALVLRLLRIADFYKVEKPDCLKGVAWDPNWNQF